MALLVSTISSETKTLMKNNVRLGVIGCVDTLPKDVHRKLMECIEATSVNSGLTLNLALSYSSRWDRITSYNVCYTKLLRSTSVDKVIASLEYLQRN